MAQSRWHIVRDGDALTVARRLPARFDLAAQTRLVGAAQVSRARVAHQVRQDMWRALQDLRGFSPVVEVRRCGGDMVVQAGGAVSGALPRAKAEAAIAAVLEDAANRRRWTRHAGQGRLTCA